MARATAAQMAAPFPRCWAASKVAADEASIKARVLVTRIVPKYPPGFRWRRSTSAAF